MDDLHLHERVWQIGLDALTFTGGGVIWAIIGVGALFPVGGPFVPLGAALLVALLAGASGRCLQWAAQASASPVKRGPTAASLPPSGTHLIMRAAFVGIALAVVFCLWIVPAGQVVPALALVSALHCLALARLSRVPLGTLVGIMLGGLALTTMLLAPEQADARAMVGLGSALVLWSGAVMQLQHGAALVARARPQ